MHQGKGSGLGAGTNKRSRKPEDRDLKTAILEADQGVDGILQKGYGGRGIGRGVVATCLHFFKSKEVPKQVYGKCDQFKPCSWHLCLFSHMWTVVRAGQAQQGHWGRMAL